ncbi:erythromycin esterase family protein [Tenacibaculum jejuense]|nr:erythromycin esterase family protein [Tenacibaculum jejuense]
MIKLNSQTFTKISNKEFENSNFKELSFLQEELKNVQIIGLGEALHNMGGTYTAKVKMVKYLHKKCGFDVIAFESPFYNSSKVNELIKKGQANKDSINYNISGVWSTSETKELFEYIIETQKTDRPLEFIGFDESFFASTDTQDLTKDYANFINNLEEENKISFKLDSTFYNAINTVADRSYSFSKRAPQDTLLLYNKFREIRKELSKIEKKDNLFNDFWSEVTNNLQSVYRKNYKRSNRDKRMASNVKFLANKKYPNKKIMLWAATSHLLSNPNSIKNYRVSKKYNKKKMGVYLKKEYGERYYVMAFTPFKGKFGFKGMLGLGKTKVRSKKGGLEYYINNKYDSDFVYLSLKNKDNINEIKKNKIGRSNIVWLEGMRYKGEIMDIPNAVDGIFYLKDERLVNSKKISSN